MPEDAIESSNLPHHGPGTSPLRNHRPPAEDLPVLTTGSLFLRVREYTLAHHGPEGWSELLAALSPSDAHDVDHVLAIGHYDTLLLSRLYRALEATAGHADPQVLDRFGAWTAEQDLHTTQRLFLRFASPAYVFEKTGAYWSRFHDAGQWAMTRHGSSAATGVLTGFIACETFCRTLVPYIRRILELGGTRGVHVDHPRCRGRSDADCAFHLRWRP